MTNLPFLRWLVSHPVVRSGHATTAFLTEHPPSRRSRYGSPLLPFERRGDSISPLRLSRRRRTSTSSHSARPLCTARLGHGTDAGDSHPFEVQAGDDIRARQPLVVLEAMKMEIPVASPFEGTVTTCT